MNFGIIWVRSFLRYSLLRNRQRRLDGSKRRGAALIRPCLTHLTYLTIPLLFAPLVARTQAQEFQFQAVGARVGFPAKSTSEHFLESEAFLNYNLWRWNLSTNWHLQSRIDLSAGWLGGRGEDAFIGSLGPSLELSRSGIPLSLEGGFSPTYISRYKFGPIDLGTEAQFTTSIGLNWDITSHLRVGYRFDHMSNAGIKEPNPGFNLHTFAIAYLF